MPAGVSVVDVGAGDGKLAAWLAAAGRRVIATENKPGPLAEVRRRLDPLGIECRLGEGLLPLAPGEVQVAVIAGMGGRTIASILAASPEVVRSLEGLILQPVRVLQETAEKVSKGDLNIRSHIATGDEFETLSKTFNVIGLLSDLVNDVAVDDVIA